MKTWRTTEGEMVGWQYQLNGHEFEQTPGVGGGRTGKPSILQSVGLQRVRHNWATELNWIEGTSATLLSINISLCIIKYSILRVPENPMDRGAWWAAVHGVARSRTRLSDFPFTFHFHALEREMATHSSVLAWRIQGRRSVVGCRLWGRTESDTTEAT